MISFLCRRGVGSGLQYVSRRWRKWGAKSITRAVAAMACWWGRNATLETTRRADQLGVSARWRRGTVVVRAGATRSGRRRPTTLARFGLAYDPRRPYHPVKIRVMISARWRRGDGTRRTGCAWSRRWRRRGRQRVRAPRESGGAVAAAPSSRSRDTQVKVKEGAAHGKSRSRLDSGDGGHGQRDPIGLRAKGYASWPVEKRVEFFAKTGVNWAELKKG